VSTTVRRSAPAPEYPWARDIHAAVRIAGLAVEDLREPNELLRGPGTGAGKSSDSGGGSVQ